MKGEKIMIRKSKNLLVLIMLIVFGTLIGNVVAELARDSQYFHWLAYGRQFGISTDNPLLLELGMITMKLGLMLNLTVSSIIGIIVSVIVYRRI